MWSDEPNGTIVHDSADGSPSPSESAPRPPAPRAEAQTAVNGNDGMPGQGSTSLSLRLSTSTPSMPSLIAHAKTSPILRSKSRGDSSDSAAGDYDDERSELERKKNENGLFTLPEPLAGQAMFTSPAGARAAPARIMGVPLLRTVSSRERVDEPLTYNRVRIEYAEHVASKEMTDMANLIRQALQLRRHFVYRSPNRDTTEFDIRLNPPFQHPSDHLPPATRHGYLAVAGVFVAWEGDQSSPPDVPQLFSAALSSPSVSSQQALASPPRSAAAASSIFPDMRRNQSTSPPSLSPAFFTCPSRSDYALALSLIMDIVSSGPLRSFCYNRLYLLESRFNLHRNLNGDLESLAQRAVPHRDFYNVRKVDNHIHHSSCMNQKHLLRFIKHKLKQDSGETVIVRDGRPLTLSQVFESLHLTPYDLSVDTLDMHADVKTFHRFDKFNLKYNPIGESRLREIFLKYNNHNRGRFLAEITQQVFDDLESNKYQFAEYRLSIYGGARSEWDVMGDWVCSNRLFHYNVRWMVQVPRLYAVYKAAGKVASFGEMLDNIFAPLFEVTVNPASHPSLHRFLQQCVAFDIVDDESVRERAFSDHLPTPDKFDGPVDPPYSYFGFYMYANLYVLNQLRASKGFTVLGFRPHSGEAGDAEHLACAFLLAQSINHGIMLSKSPSLQYLYYLAQIGISMSPLSNNLLFLEYDKNPFPRFFQRGLNVTLSTDDPLQISVTREPLVEEYSVAAQVWKLSSVDMSEIARNSVLQSGWEHCYKAHFLGNRYWLRGLQGNDIRQTNVPAIRVQFRDELLTEEMRILSKHADQPLNHHLVDPL